MGESSKISWTDHTFNPWWGCTKVGGSPACDNCYAESFSASVGFGAHPKDPNKFPIWGDDAQRRYFGDKHWNEPRKWDLLAQASGDPALVFCASMSDWAEGRPEQAPHLARLWNLQGELSWLIWLMLTKRPQLIGKLCPPGTPGNGRRWFGTTAETQKWLDLRWEHLKRVESPVYWLSIEPLFEAVTLPTDFLALGKRAWVIVGGESGHSARPMDPRWVRALRDQCLTAGVPFHFKQWGEWAPTAQIGFGGNERRATHVFRTGETSNGLPTGIEMMRIGAKASGAVIDGREWREFSANW